MWGVLAAVRAMRAEEDAGRQELVLAGGIGRGAAFASALVRDRRRNGHSLARRVRRSRRRAASGRRVGVSRAGRRRGRAGVRRGRRGCEPGRAEPPARARHRQRCACRGVRRARRRRHVVGRRVAALGDAARLDRGAAGVRESAPVGPAASGRGGRGAARGRGCDRTPSRRRRGALPRPRQRSAERPSARLADGAGAARRAWDARRLAPRDERVRLRARRHLRQRLRGRHLEEPPGPAEEARADVDHDAGRLPRVHVPLLHLRGQPVRLLAGGRGAPGGGGSAARDAARAAGRAAALADGTHRARGRCGGRALARRRCARVGRRGVAGGRRPVRRRA